MCWTRGVLTINGLDISVVCRIRHFFNKQLTFLDRSKNKFTKNQKLAILGDLTRRFHPNYLFNNLPFDSLTVI